MKNVKLGFCSQLLDGDDIWFSFPELPAIGKYDCRAKKGEIVKDVPVTHGFADLFADVAAYGEDLFFLPRNDDKVIVYNKKTGELRTAPLPYVFHDDRICYSIIYDEYALIFSTIPGEEVLLFSFQTLSYQVKKSLTATIEDLFQNVAKRDFSVKKYQDFIAILDRYGRKFFILQGPDVFREVSLENIPASFYEFYIIDNEVWITTIESASVFTFSIDNSTNIREIVSREDDFLRDLTSFPYSYMYKWGGYVIALNAHKARPSVLSGDRLEDFEDSNTYDGGIRGYGYGGVYTSAVPYNDLLILLPYKGIDVIYLDSELHVVDRGSTDIFLNEQEFQLFSTAIFNTGVSVRESKYLGLNDLLATKGEI